MDRKISQPKIVVIPWFQYGCAQKRFTYERDVHQKSSANVAVWGHRLRSVESVAVPHDTLPLP